MYIQFTDEGLYEALSDSTIVKIKMGSHLYGCDTESSDLDYLCIYREGISNESSYLWEHHPYQYKKNGIDYNFTSLQCFIRNLINGDSPHNFEVLYSKELMSDGTISWLSKYKEHFMNYNLIRSYLGLAKRDIKDYNHETFNGTKECTPYAFKKAFNVLRGVEVAKMLMNGKYNNDFISLKSIKMGVVPDSQYVHDLVAVNANSMEFLRDLLNDRLKNGSIKKIIDPVVAKKLDDELMSTCTSNRYKWRQLLYIDYLGIPYNAMESGVNNPRKQ